MVKKALIFAGLTLVSPLLSMEAPPRPNKRFAREDINSVPLKIQKTQLLSISLWLSSLPEDQRLQEIENLLQQLPLFTFWQSRNGFKHLDIPEELYNPNEENEDPELQDPNTLLELRAKLLDLIVAQVKEGSDAFNARLIPLLIHYQTIWAKPSLIDYCIEIIGKLRGIEPDAIDYLMPALKKIIQHAPPSAHFDALYCAIARNDCLSDAYRDLELLHELGIKLWACDPDGHTILNYVQNMKIVNVYFLQYVELLAFYQEHSGQVMLKHS